MQFQKLYKVNPDLHTVFEAWLSPRTVISPITRIESEPFVGGKYILYSEVNGEVSQMNGKVLELVNNKLIKYSWHWLGNKEETLITVSFSTENKATQIDLLHENFLSSESRDMHASGWDHYIAELEKFLS